MSDNLNKKGLQGKLNGADVHYIDTYRINILKVTPHNVKLIIKHDV